MRERDDLVAGAHERGALRVVALERVPARVVLETLELDDEARVLPERVDDVSLHHHVERGIGQPRSSYEIEKEALELGPGVDGLGSVVCEQLPEDACAAPAVAALCERPELRVIQCAEPFGSLVGAEELGTGE